MRYATLCSGIEACSVAWKPLGFKPVFFSEIAEFPNAVLKHHYPRVPNLGDMTKYHEWKDYGTVDLVCAGTPCQAFSLAGLREGLQDPRGNLTLTFLGVLERYRPRWVVWENVTGVLSDPTNAFGNFLGGLAELGYGFAYRVLDARHFGVPQRRRRVFVVGYLGDWRPSATVLFEPNCLSGIPPQGGRNRKANSCGVQGGSLAPSRYYSSHPSDSRITGAHEIADTVSARYGTGGGNIPFILSSYSPRQVSDAVTSKWAKQSGGYSGSETSIMVLSMLRDEAFYRIRRMTPLECERLMGFPDNYTVVSWKRKRMPDHLRYEAIGNSMVVPVMEWLGRRIQEVDKLIKNNA